jgi:hypothetical protein
MKCITCGREVDNPELKGEYCSIKCARAAIGHDDVVEKPAAAKKPAGRKARGRKKGAS